MQSGVETLKINVNLEANTQATIDNIEPVILPENELILAFNSKVYRINELLVFIRSEYGEKTYKLKLPLNVDISEFLKPSVIEGEISLLSKGEIVKTWRLPNLTIKEYSPTYKVTPEIAKINEEIKLLREGVTEINNILKRNFLI